MTTVKEAVTEGFTLLVASESDDASRQAARIVADQINGRPESLVCVAAGNTPTRTYVQLGEMAAQEQFSTDRMIIAKLDEWLDLPMDDPHTCDSYIRQHLLDPLSIPDDRYIAFDSRPADAQSECRRVGAEIARRGGIDLAILGIGVNGHLGLNEPGPFTQASCHVAELATASTEHSMLEGVTQPVRCGITLGMGDLLQARRILLLAFGDHKAEAIGKLLRQQVSPQLPASFLWLHPHVTCICDRVAASEIG